MRVIEDVRSAAARFDRVVLTVGCFDGVHLGHRQILLDVLRAARACDGVPAVMTLEPLPRQFFAPNHTPNILTPPQLKRRLFEELGVEVVYTLPFDETTATMTPEDFVRHILVEKCHVHTLVVGHDFAFGRDARGDHAFLCRAAAEQGFQTIQTPPLIIDGQRVSSTLIRERIVQGELEDIERYLGRKYCLSGVVQPGRGIGRILGFPTANLDVGTSAVPAHGVYCAEALLDGTRHRAAVNIGIAPTIRDALPLIEAHLLDFEGDLAEREMHLVLHRRLRPEKKFSSRAELIAAIAHDVETVRQSLPA